jgi:hypothetical protein
MNAINSAGDRLINVIQTNRTVSKNVVFLVFKRVDRRWIRGVLCFCSGKCLEVQTNAYILAKGCEKNETRQLWRYKQTSGELVNVWCRYCATHVTDPDLKTPGERQIMMAQECAADTTEDGEFKRWEFITL